MHLSITNLGKRFNRNWIFRGLTETLIPNTAVAITGPNGSGKSTLLQVLAGAVEKSEGSMEWVMKGIKVPEEKQFTQVSVCAPYLELIEELTLVEFLEFHASFKPFRDGLGIADIVGLMSLQHAANQQIRYFSSGMKQRVKLAQAVLADTAFLLLDEPTSNLDLKGIDMYQQWMQQFSANRLVVIASNDENEIGFCSKRIHISDYKK